MLEVRQRGGVFGPGGYGGGIFDGSQGGFGGLGAYYGNDRPPEQAAAGVFGALGQIYAGVENPKVRRAQQLANDVLEALNYATIEEDGKLGPATCGAIAYVYSQIPIEELNFVATEANAFASYVRSAPELESACTQQIAQSRWVTPSRLGPPPSPEPASEEPSMEFEEPEVLAPPGACEFEFGDSHPQIKTLQAQLNEALDAEGYEQIPVTGTYDPQTCGAIFELGGAFSPAPSELCPRGWTVPLECADMVIPKKKSENGVSTAAMWGIGGLLALAAVGGIYAATKGG